MSTCIEVDNLTKSFHGRTVVDSISFRVETGEVFGFLGHNGAGKSTTIDLMPGLKKRIVYEICKQMSALYDDPEERSRDCPLRWH